MCPSVHMGKVDSCRTNFCEILQRVFFLNFVDTSKFLLKSDDRKVRFTRKPTYMYDIAPCVLNGEIMRYYVA
jgi:hypothetical protein